MSTEGLKRVIGKLRRGRGREKVAAVSVQPESTFDVVLDLRLGELQRQVGEIKGRVNSLFFFVLGAAVVQVGLRVLV